MDNEPNLISDEISLRKEVERINAEKSEKRLRLILDNSFNMIALCDLGGNIIYCNDSYREVLGFSPETLIKSNIFTLFHPDEREKAKEDIFIQLLNEGKGQMESRFITKEGYYKFLDHRFRLVDENDTGRDTIVISSQDISEKKRSEMILTVQRNLAYSVITSRSFLEFYKTIIRELNSIMEVNNIYVAFYNEKRGVFRLAGISDERDEIDEWPAEGSLTGLVMEYGKPVIFYKDDVLRMHDEGKVELIGTTAEVWLGAPVKSGDKTIGAIVIQNYDSPDAFTKSDLEIIEIIANEITIFLEMKSAEEASQKLNIAVIQSPASVLITDADGNIEFVNPKFSRVTGYEIGEILGKNPNILNSGMQPKELYKEMWDTISSGREWRGELQNRKKNGEFYWEDISISPIFNESGVIVNYVGVKEDITDRKKLIGDLITAKEKAEESDRLKTAFLQNISHEIRTPMNSILGFIELLQEPDTSGEERQEYIGIIEKSGHRMLGTINDIINISKIEAGIMSVQINTIELASVVNEVTGMFRPEAEKKGMHIQSELPELNDKTTIESDYEKVFAIFTNLVKNAIKYSNHGTITVGYVSHPNSVECFVKDTGIGISKEIQSAIFERFTRAEVHSRRSVEGAGLGLSIVKGYLQLLGGSIYLQSEPGEGSKFTFELPKVLK